MICDERRVLFAGLTGGYSEDFMGMTRIEMREKLKDRLTDKRYEHSLGVEYTAACMAMCHNMDIEQAAIAGLLHDCAKNYTATEKIMKCEKYGLPISGYERQNPELLHAKLGAAVARDKFRIKDREILSAITWHTTGRPNMTELDKVIYIADFIEPNRKYLPEMDEIRKEAFTDLDKCLIHILSNILEYLKRKGSTIDQITEQTYEFYVGQYK